VYAELVNKRKQAGLGRELLLGFKPVEAFVESIEQRFGDVATICADFQGGAYIGIKWRSAVSVYSCVKKSDTSDNESEFEIVGSTVRLYSFVEMIQALRQ